jgi:hypothetical protein
MMDGAFDLMECSSIFPERRSNPWRLPTKGASMKEKPGWPRWIAWFVIYTVVDFGIARLWHGAFLRSDVNDALEGAMAAATMSWLIALYKWHKADSAL